MTRKTADDIIEEIWNNIRDGYKTFASNGNRCHGLDSQQANSENTCSQEPRFKKKANVH
jgi:hypothetical protein